MFASAKGFSLVICFLCHIFLCCRNSRFDHHRLRPHFCLAVNLIKISRYGIFLACCCIITEITDICIQRQGCIFILVIQLCFYKQVTHLYFCFRVKIYITENTAHTDKVLVLQVTSGGPAVNFHSDSIFTLFQITCNVKLIRCVAVFAVSDSLSVYI